MEMTIDETVARRKKSISIQEQQVLSQNSIDDKRIAKQTQELR